MMPKQSIVRSHPDGALVTVWVVPGAHRTEVVGIHGDAIRVRVAAAPEGGRANGALIDLLEREIGVRVRLASGAGSRRKRVVAVGMSPDLLRAWVAGLAN